MDNFTDECIHGGLLLGNGSGSGGETGGEVLYEYECLVMVMLNVTEFIQKAFFPKSPNSVETLFFSAAYVLITVLGLLGNGLVIVVVIGRKEMRTSRNVLITNLAISNLLLALILYPFLWYPAMQVTFPFGTFFCKTANAFPGSNVYCSTLTISLMAVDRFYSVAQTSSNPNAGRGDKRWVAVLWAMGVWVVSMVLSLPILLFYQITYYPDWSATLPLYPNGNEVTKVVAVIQISFLYLIPLCVLLVFNIRLTRFLSQHTKKSAGHDTLRDARSQAVIAAEKRQARTTKLLNAMAISYAVLWLPFITLSFLYDFKLTSNLTPEGKKVLSVFDNVAKLISMVSICVNPFLYGYLNTNFNREFKRIFAAFHLVKSEEQQERSSRTCGNGTQRTFLPQNSNNSLLSQTQITSHAVPLNLNAIPDKGGNNQATNSGMTKPNDDPDLKEDSEGETCPLMDHKHQVQIQLITRAHTESLV